MQQQVHCDFQLELRRLHAYDFEGKAGLPRGRSADILRSLTSYVLGYTMLNRLRPQQPNRSAPPDSFDVGLEMMMRSLREELGR